MATKKRLLSNLLICVGLALMTIGGVISGPVPWFITFPTVCSGLGFILVAFAIDAFD